MLFRLRKTATMPIARTTLLFLYILILLMALGEAFLFFTGSKTLLAETIVSVGEPFKDEETINIFGDYNNLERPQLVCKYFNGRKVVFRQFPYSSKNSEGIDACPSFLKPRQ